ncbi:MAG: ABC transporter substrate-binding protein [Synechococcus sp.]|nr:ABC transporter substrate-binding protein [Synechococcus sp.]
MFPDRLNLKLTLACGIGLVLALALPSKAEVQRQLLLGQSAAFSGPSGMIGRNYRAGAEAYFSEVNRLGGVHGRTVRLLSRDDRYEPARALKNTRELIQGDKVFALFGYVGTPTTVAILPLVEKSKIPLIAPLSGAQVMRKPHRPLVFNLRASYHQEIDRIINYLVRSGRHRIAVVYQNDSFGQDGLKGAERALKRHDLEPIATASVERNSTSTGGAASSVVNASANAVLVVAAYPSSASLTRELRQKGSTAQLMNVSFVGAEALQASMRSHEASGIGVSQVVPFPWNERVPVVKEYQALMVRRQYKPKFGFYSLEGFLAAKVTVEGLRRAGPSPTRQRFMAALESLQDYDLGGFRVHLGPRDHNGSDFVHLTFLGTQRWEP